MVRITCERSLAKFVEDFENDWQRAEEVTSAMIMKMMNKYRERSRSKSQESISDDQSTPEDRGRSNSLSRDLMSELNT
eukprot:9756762-Karenia_brevis.AAC.1